MKVMSKKLTYIPPFTVSSNAINLIAEISSLIERYVIRLEQSDGLKLRKANRIKTIHSSLAIEGNNLSESQVTDIINGKNVVAPLREIQEVKNAIRTYELFQSLNPFEVKDLLKAHKVMMESLIDDNGKFRQGDVGVFSGDRCIHMAPPAQQVPFLIKDLFTWLKYAPDHLLIRSCVFHYEFEFIHPFIDGNGRMGRMWQSLILGQLHPIFEHLPIESLVNHNQQMYYNAIALSSQKVDCSPFIDFMLGEILNTLKKYQGTPIDNELPNKLPKNFPNKLKIIHPSFNNLTWKVLECIIENPYTTSKEIGLSLNISDRTARSHISILKNANIITRIGGNKGGHWEVNDNS